MDSRFLLRATSLTLAAIVAGQVTDVCAAPPAPAGQVQRHAASSNNFASLTAEECFAKTQVTITGDVSEEDFRIVRDKMLNVTVINMAGANVTKLPAYAFAGMYKLRSVTLPDGLKEIGDAAFLSCHDLNTVNIPAGVTRVGALAFSRTAVSKVSFPASVTEIGRDALFFCRDLRVIEVAEGNTAYTTIGGALFTADKTRLIKRAPLQAGRAITLPAELKTIDAHACAGCNIMSTPTLPEGLETIGNYAFAHCPGMQDQIVIPSTVKTIGEGAFFYASSAPRSIVIPAGVTEIGARAFAYMDQLKTVEIPSTVKNIPQSAFECDKAITTIKCDATVPPVVGDFAMRGVDRSSTFIDVPDADAYRKAPVWEEFENYDTPTAVQYEFFNKDGVYFIRYCGEGPADGKYLQFNLTDNQPANLVDSEEEASQWQLEFFNVTAAALPFAGNPGADIRYYTADRVHHINYQGLCWNDPSAGYNINNNRTFGFYMKSPDYNVDEGPLTAIVGNGTVWGANTAGTSLATTAFTGKNPMSRNFVWRIEPVEKVAIGSVETATEEAPASYFNLSGIKVESPRGGAFIKVDANGKASKVIL